MKVICSGYPKTGTKTMCAALRQLGYHVYDFEEQFLFLGDDLQKALDYGISPDKLREIFRDVDAITDVPGCAIWEELAEAFPNAKIIHTERSSDEEWAESMLNQMIAVFHHPWMTLFGQISSPTGRRANRIANSSFRVLMSRSPFNSWSRPPLNMTMEKLRYRQHNAYVRQAVSKDRLLVFDVKEGWNPLCKFLGIPVPSEPFPHKNKSGSEVSSIIEHSRMSDLIKREAITFIIGCVLLVVAIALIFLIFFM